MLGKLVNYLRYHVLVRGADLRRALRLERTWRRRRDAVRRAVPASNGLIVSLTSYPPRFGTLHLTLKSLLLQSFPADRVELWIAHGDMAALPASVRELQPYGLVIKSCDDLKSYKKLIPALAEDASLTIVTADDDIDYWPDWLRQLVDARVPGQAEVICHRMHQMLLGADGLPLPYNAWVQDAPDSSASVLHFPTGIGGVLYPPGIFGPDILNSAAFMALCPRGDDVWFYWMARSNGARFRRVPQRNPIHSWEGSQDAALWKDNIGGNFNDTQIQAMIRSYGFFEWRRVG